MRNATPAWRAGACLCLFSFWLAQSGAASEARWPQFRGPGASGVATNGSFPAEFNPSTNLAWKLAVPPGNSSPCVWDNALFLTAGSNGVLSTICIDAHGGAVRWEKTVPARASESAGGAGNPASPTPCTDGERVISYFGPFGLLCHDFAGRELWRCPLPTPVTQHGVGTSPVLAGDRVIVLRDQDVGSCLLALDKRSGEIVWRTERPEFRRGFCTPLVTQVAGAGIIVAPGTLRVAAYGAGDGRLLWQLPGLPNESCSSPVVGEGLIFAGGWTSGAGVPRMPAFDGLLAGMDANGDGRLSREETREGPARNHFAYIDADKDGLLTRVEYDFIAEVFNHSKNALLAIRPGGAAAVATAEVAWSQTRGLPYVPTPLVYRGRLYLVRNGGLISCLNASTGAVLYQEERLGVMGDNYASPVAADGRICVASQSGTVAVLAAGDTLQVLARNALGEPVMATPAIAANTLYVRSQKHLWAFRESGNPAK